MTHNHQEVDPAAVPKWILPPFFVCEQRLQEEGKYLHLTMRGLGQLQVLPTVLEALHKVDAEIESEAGGTAPSKLEAAKQDADWIAKEARAGFPILHAHAVVGIWSALEVLCEDFAIAWLRNLPEAWSVPEVAKLKIPIAKYQQLNESERPRLIVSELSRSLSTDLRKGVGKLNSLLVVFDLAPSVGPNVQRALHELCQVRNVIVHCGGLADEKLVEECPWLGIRVGERVQVDHPVYGWYYRAARRYAERVSNQAMVALGFEGCKCPGMDEIDARPDGALAPPRSA
jgi:hypothetical protein